MRRQNFYIKHLTEQTIPFTRKLHFWATDTILNIHTDSIIDTGDILEIVHHTDKPVRLKIIEVIDSGTSQYYRTHGKKDLFYELKFKRI